MNIVGKESYRVYSKTCRNGLGGEDMPLVSWSKEYNDALIVWVVSDSVGPVAQFW